MNEVVKVVVKKHIFMVKKCKIYIRLTPALLYNM